MAKLPEKVIEMVKRLRAESDHYLSVKVINDHLYIYEATSKWDKQRRKVRSISRYLGRITKDGLFIPGIRRDAELGAMRIEREFEAKEPRRARSKRMVADDTPYSSEYENAILERLSANGRISLPRLGKDIGLSLGTLEGHRKAIERKYDIQYIPELDIGKLGYREYLIMIKFEGDAPGLNEMKRVLDKEPAVQLALLTQGDYDLVLHTLLGNDANISEEITMLRSRLFADYPLRLQITPFYRSYGAVPLRVEFFSLLKDKIRASNDATGGGTRLSNREYLLLKDLSGDGSMDFSKIDSSNRFGPGSARYTYQRLIDKGILKRITISMRDIQAKYIAMIMLEKVTYADFAKERDYLKQVLAAGTENAMDKYALVGDIQAPDGLALILPVFSGFDLDKAMEELRKVKGARLSRLIITNVVTGSLCFRRLEGNKKV